MHSHQHVLRHEPGEKPTDRPTNRPTDTPCLSLFHETKEKYDAASESTTRPSICDQRRLHRTSPSPPSPPLVLSPDFILPPDTSFHPRLLVACCFHGNTKPCTLKSALGRSRGETDNNIPLPRQTHTHTRYMCVCVCACARTQTPVSVFVGEVGVQISVHVLVQTDCE